MKLSEFTRNLPPTWHRNMARRRKVWRIQFAMRHYLPWMHWPILAFMYSFWSSIFEEGVVDTCKPRWGMLTFAYLNDGFKPTIWHAVYQILHPLDKGEHSGIYPSGAPSLGVKELFK